MITAHLSNLSPTHGCSVHFGVRYIPDVSYRLRNRQKIIRGGGRRAPGGEGRFEIPKFSLSFASWVLIIFFASKKTWEKNQILKLKTAGREMVNFVIMKFFLLIFLFLLYKFTSFASRLFSISRSDTSSRSFRCNIRWLRLREQKSERILENRNALPRGGWGYSGRLSDI